MFPDLSSDSGKQKLNDFLENASFIQGYQPSQADVSVFDGLGKAPPAKFAHALRWYNNIASYNLAERKSWGGQACPVTAGAKPTTAPAPAPAKAPADDDDDVDLFGSDDEEESKEAAAIREKRLQEYNEKKSKKPGLIAKSSILLDVKPWDDETDMKKMEEFVRTIEMDGLVWGASKLVPVGYGIHKLQIMCVIEDDKISVDLLQERIEEFEECVQSVDIAAFNKI